MSILNKKSFLTKILIIFIVVLCILKTNSNAIVSPTSDFYVNDYAEVLSDAQEEELCGYPLAPEEVE